MKNKKVICQKLFPRRSPIAPTIYIPAACKVYGAPEWLYGAIGVFLFLLWAVYLSKLFSEKEIEIDVFEDLFKKPEPSKMPDPFKSTPVTRQDRLDQKKNGINF
jgi:hypothetical protein